MSDASSLMPPVRLLSLTYLDEAFTNAQQVNARAIISRLVPSAVECTAFAVGRIDPQLADKPSLRVVELGSRGKAVRIAATMLGRFDIIWYPHPGPAEVLYLRLIRPLVPVRRRPAIVLPIEGDVAQYDEIPRVLRRRVETVLRNADVVVPISRYVKRSLESRFGRSGPVIPVGVDTKEFLPAATKSGEPPLRVVTVGTLKAWKRPELTLAAARCFPDCRFVVVGDGPMLPELRASAPPNVEFHGPVPRAAMPGVLRDCDVLLHPSRMEGMPKAVLEGMACGLPPVLFDAYQPDWVASGESGFVVGTEAEMIEALGCLLKDGNLRRTMGHAARRVAQRYDWDIVARMWEELFFKVAALRRAGLSLRSPEERQASQVGRR